MNGRIVRLLSRVRRALKPPFLPITSRIHIWVEGSLGAIGSKPQVLAYQLIGEKTDRVLPLFRGVDSNLEKSESRVSFRAYVSWTILACLLASSATVVLVPVTLILIGHLSPMISLLFGVGGAMFAGVFTVIAFYSYPILKADSIRKNIENELPFTTSYMAILASAGVSPERIFQSLASARVSQAVSVEARTVVRDVELLGSDVVSAFESSSRRASSQKFKEFMEGFIGTIHSGGDLAAYLTDRSSQYMEERRLASRKFADTLSVMAEFYVTMLVAGPLIFVVMLAVMGMLGGGSGLFNPVMLLTLLTYVGVPLGSLAFLVLVDMISPEG